MKIRFRSLIIAGGLMASAGSLVWAAGLNATLPVVGAQSFCGSTVSGVQLPAGQGPYGVTPGSTQGTGQGICGQTIPAGPVAVTGEEIIQADTQLPGGQSPQVVGIPTGILGGSQNRLIGGDFNTNLAQRLSTTKGIAALAGFSPTAAVITADRWWAYSTGSQATATIASGATEILPALNTTKALRIARPSGQTPSGAICVGQTLDINQSSPLIGNNAIFSWYGLNGATMSATNGQVTAQIAYSSNAAAAGTQATLGFAGSVGSKYALAGSGQAGGPTNYTVATPVLSNGVTGSIATTGVVTIPQSTTWTRYSFAAPIPVNIPGGTTAVTDVSVQICFLPTATSAVTTDWIELQGLQLEPAPSTATASLPNGIITPRGFERRAAAVEAAYSYYYWYFNYENQAAINPVASCENTATTATNCLVQFPEPMRVAPAMQYTAGFQAFAQVAETSVSACSALASSVSYATVPGNSGVLLTCTATVGAAGTANQLTSLGTSSATGIISASAEP